MLGGNFAVDGGVAHCCLLGGNFAIKRIVTLKASVSGMIAWEFGIGFVEGLAIIGINISFKRHLNVTMYHLLPFGHILIIS
ncbi:hypothetical protein ACJX0J_034117, partial [Zea mays]